MIISQSAKLIFIHIQRTGGTTLINLLKKQFQNRIEIISQHGNARSIEKNLLTDYKNYFTFAFVRNPWDRILSWYLLVNKSDHTNIEVERIKYERFLELDLAFTPNDLYFHYNQYDYVSNEQGELLTDKIYRFENYKSEIDMLFEDLHLPKINIPQLNISRHKNYREYYSQRSQELVAQKCKKDIEYFGYNF